MSAGIRNDARPAAEALPTEVAVVGDVHGHLQLALCMLARWQAELNVRFEAVFLCGDVGTFTEDAQLDNATRSHAKTNECELEFLRQWSTHPQAPWLEHIFRPADDDGLGLCCPVVMVHGNHDGFAHLETLSSRRRRPAEPVPLAQLRGVDTREFIGYLPSGWRAVTPSGLVVGGVGGMQSGQRARTRYHPMAYVDDDDAVEALLDAGPLDLLITHQGPSETQLGHGSESLQLLLDAGVARAWFHGHSTPNEAIVRAGPGDACTVVPLGDIAFAGKGGADPGLKGWARVRREGDGELAVVRETPPFWREFRRHQWLRLPDGRLVAPPLARFVPRG